MRGREKAPRTAGRRAVPTRVKKEEKKSVFFTKTGLDRDFVDAVCDQCYTFVLNRGGATVEDTYKFVQESGLTNVEIHREEIGLLLDKLVYAGSLDDAPNPKSTTPYTQKIYKPAKATLPECSLTGVPCGKCPYAQTCFPENVACNPRICRFFDEFLDVGDDNADEPN